MTFILNLDHKNNVIYNTKSKKYKKMLFENFERKKQRKKTITQKQKIQIKSKI